MKQFIDGMLAKMDAETWKEKTTKAYRINVLKTVSRGNSKERFGFDRILNEQTEEYPRGITKEMAIDLAGKEGQVYEIVTSIKRIK